jgi:hypothetical protein
MGSGRLGIALSAFGLVGCEDFREGDPRANEWLASCPAAPPAATAPTPNARCEDAPARLIGPLAGSRVTGGRVRLRWELPPGADGAELVLCDRRACDGAVRRQLVNGTDALPLYGAREGRAVYWRVSPRRRGAPCGRDSAVWWYTPEPGSACGEGKAWRVAADGNNDGVPDFIASGHTALRVYVYHGGRNGLSTPQEIEQNEVGSQFGTHIHIGDLDGDGRQELVTPTLRPPPRGDDRSTVWVYRGASGWRADDVLDFTDDRAGTRRDIGGVADLDGDGYGDVITTAFLDGSAGPQHVEVLFGGPDVALSRRVIALRNAGVRTDIVGVIDVNNDGQDDLLVPIARGVYHVYVNRFGSFSASPDVVLDHVGDQSIVGNSFALSRVAGDFNGDGALDLIVFRSGEFLVVVYGQRGRMPNFDDYTQPLPPLVLRGIMPGFPGFPLTGDFTGDGLTDLVIAPSLWVQPATTSSNLLLFPGSSGGLRTQPLAPIWVPDGAVSGATAGDYDGDGTLDLAAADHTWNDNRGRGYWFRGRRGADAWVERVPGYLTRRDMDQARFGFNSW